MKIACVSKGLIEHQMDQAQKLLLDARQKGDVKEIEAATELLKKLKCRRIERQP